MKETIDQNNPHIAILEYTDEEALALGPQIALDGNQIIRYMNLSKFYSILTDNSIWFSRMDQFTDKYEGLAIVNTTSEDVEYFRKQSVVNSWNHFTKESYALWRIYLSKEESGIAIVSTVGDFLNSISDPKVKDFTDALVVRYVPHNKTFEGINNQLLASRKKDFYEYEEEIRFNYQDPSLIKTEQPKGLAINLDPSKLIKKIILSPYMPNWVEKSVRNILNKYGLGSIEIVQSEIKDNL